MANCLRLAASLDWPYTHRPGDSPSCCSASRQGSSVARRPPPWHGMSGHTLTHLPPGGCMGFFPSLFLGLPGGLSE